MHDYSVVLRAICGGYVLSVDKWAKAIYNLNAICWLQFVHCYMHFEDGNEMLVIGLIREAHRSDVPHYRYRLWEYGMHLEGQGGVFRHSETVENGNGLSIHDIFMDGCGFGQFCAFTVKMIWKLD